MDVLKPKISQTSQNNGENDKITADIYTTAGVTMTTPAAGKTDMTALGEFTSDIDFAGDIDWIKLEVQAGHQYDFSFLTPAASAQGPNKNVAPRIAGVYDENGGDLDGLTVDADGAGYTFSPTASGIIYFAVAGPEKHGSDSTGTYHVQIGESPKPTLKENSAPTTTHINAGVHNEDDAEITLNLLQNAHDQDGDALTIENLQITASDGSTIGYTIDENGNISLNMADLQYLQSVNYHRALYFTGTDGTEEYGNGEDVEYFASSISSNGPNGQGSYDMTGRYNYTYGSWGIIDVGADWHDEMTVSTYVRLDNTSGALLQEIFSFGSVQDSHGIQISTDPKDTDGNYDITLKAAAKYNETAPNYELKTVTLQDALPQGEWAHVTLSISQDGVAKLYINGELALTETGIYVPTSVLPETGGTAANHLDYIKDQNIGRSGFYPQETEIGALSTFQYLDHALTDEQVGAMYQSGGILVAPQDVELNITYDVVDVNGGRTSGTAAVVVSGENDAPIVSQSLAHTLDEDQVIRINLLEHASDVDAGDVMTAQFQSIDLPEGFTFDSETNELIIDTTLDTYHFLNTGEVAEFSFDYEITDTHNATVSQTLDISIIGQHQEGLSLSGTRKADYMVGSEADDTLRGYRGDDKAFGGGGDDKIYMGLGNDSIWAGEGYDLVYSGAGRDDVYGGGGNDRIYAGNGKDRLWGQDGNDNLFGEGGDDIIWGGLGDDYIDGGAGSDIMSGGAGADTFVFGPHYGADVVQDFDAAQGDLIHVNMVGIENYDQLMMIASEAEGSTVFQLDVSSITLVGHDLDDLSAEMFTFEPADMVF